MLQAQDWPGNARQLRNSIERLLILVKDQPPADGVITAALLPSDIGEVLPTVGDSDSSAHLMSLPLRDAREVFERQYLLAQIERFGGNISKTAEFVGMERSALAPQDQVAWALAIARCAGRHRISCCAIVVGEWESIEHWGRGVAARLPR